MMHGPIDIRLLFCAYPSLSKFPEITVKYNRDNYFNADQHTHAHTRARTNTHMYNIVVLMSYVKTYFNTINVTVIQL